uniref:General transcription factor IIH subunit 3 n=1 Tax=Ditylenchus dipsaci TaxID=166011 RepID=A0A915EUC3_9BILA
MSFLSVIVDCNWNWGLLLEKNNGLETFQSVLSSIVAFCNAHLLFSLNNRFDEQNFSPTDNAVEIIESKLREAVLRAVDSMEEMGGPSGSCYAAAVSLAICAFQRYSKELLNPTGRIVIINLTKDLSAEQNSLMNLFFTANQHSVAVDVAFLNGSVPILQQACDITSGTHMLVDKPEQLIQHLMEHCLVNSQECREAFAVKNDADVDYRATCHCHNKLGVFSMFVCSLPIPTVLYNLQCGVRSYSWSEEDKKEEEG